MGNRLSKPPPQPPYQPQAGRTGRCGCPRCFSRVLAPVRGPCRLFRCLRRGGLLGFRLPFWVLCCSAFVHVALGGVGVGWVVWCSLGFPFLLFLLAALAVCLPLAAGCGLGLCSSCPTAWAARGRPTTTLYTRGAAAAGAKSERSTVNGILKNSDPSRLTAYA